MRFKVIKFRCDDCGEVIETPHPTYKEAREFARLAGWRVEHIPKYDLASDLCEACKRKSLAKGIIGVFS